MTGDTYDGAISLELDAQPASSKAAKAAIPQLRILLSLPRPGGN